MSSSLLPGGLLTLDDVRSQLKTPKAFSSFSEQSICNRYLFRETYEFQLSQRWPQWLEGISSRGHALATPLDLSVVQCADAIRQATDRGCMVGPFTEAMARTYIDALGPGYGARSYRDQADYLYQTEDIAELKGPGRAKARQYVRKLRREYAVTVEMFTSRHSGAAAKINMAWRQRKEQKTDDAKATLEAIDLAVMGLLDGVCIFLDGQMTGFILFDTSIEGVIAALVMKTIQQKQGLTDICFQEVCRAFPHKRYLNTCQDLGLPGLRLRKMQMRPVEILKKWFVSRKLAGPASGWLS